MQLRHVVTCFLNHPEEPTVLLGHRSDEVHTYPGHWAAISGSVETADPVEQAFREIAEETGLARDQVRLEAEGWPIRFTDWDLGTVWVVHPFRFRCLAPDQVRRDWEHVRLEWVRPERMGRLTTVPKLQEAYVSADSADGRPDHEWAFRRIERDREHGAEELGLWTLMALQIVADRAPEDLEEACRRALSLRPSMAAVRSAALDAYGAVREHGGDASDAIQAVLDEREANSVRVGESAAARLPDGAMVVTISRSFSVLATLREAAERVDRLVVAESRPACEGRGTAELAASFGIEVELMTDAAAPGILGAADVVLFGADSLLADGSLVNKTGTFALCCAAQKHDVPALAVATQSKILPAGFRPRMEEMSPDELGKPIEGVQRRNVYFEQVPAEMIAETVAADGPLTREAINTRATRLDGLQRLLT